MYVYVYVYVCIHVCACMRVYVYMYVFIFVCIYESICIFAESRHAFTGVVQHHASAGVYVRQML